MKVNRKFLRSAERLSLSAIAKDSTAQKIVSAVTAIGFVMQPVAALASTITRADGNAVKFNENGVADIFASQVFNNNVAINQFKEFKLDANNIANMYFGTDVNGKVGNLVNFVDSRIDINGTVNAIQNKKIGGNLFFFSSNGMAVGKTGVINAGALYVATPTKTAFDEYKKLGTEDKFNTIIKDEGFAQIPINASGTINVLGKVNAVNAVNLRAAKIGVGKNVSENTIGDVAAGATATGASISTGVVNFKDIVNTNKVKSGLSGTALTAKKTGSGDIVLAASNNYNDNYKMLDDFSKIAGAKVEAELSVANGAEVKATGNAKLSAQALNNVVVEKSDQYKENYTPSTTTNSHLYGQIVTTNATVNVDGTVEATQVDITADAVNRYVSAESSVLNASNVTSNIVGALTANLDASYAVLNSKAEVNVGQSAEINATGSDTVSEGKVVKPALNIKANSSVEAGAGASTALLKVMNVAGTNIIPAAAVTYSQTHNEAAVNIDGTLKSTGGTSVTALADSKVNSEAKATTMDVSENPNLGDVALNITTGDNKSSVTIGKTAQMTELQKDVNIEAKSVNSVITKAEVSTGEKAVVATAVNVTDYDSKANVNINGNVSSKDGSLSVNAENVLTDNTVIANNAMGSSAFMKKIVTNIKGSQSLDSLIGENGAKDQLLGGIKKWLANAKYTPQKLKDKLNAPSTPSAPTEPKPWDKLADFMSTGVSVGVAVESNTADVKIGQGVALAAKNDLNITAKSVIEDTQMQVTGKSNNYDKDVDNKALVNASVLYSKLDNTATVTVAGGEEAQNPDNATNVTLTGGKVNIAANSSFEYNRINRMVQEVKDACAKVKAAYKGENHADIEAKADALSNAADAFFNYAKDNCFSSNGGEQVDFMDLFGGQKYKDFTAACSALTSALGDEAKNIAVGPINVVSAAAAFANPNSYLNFSAGSANGGKSGPGEHEKPATIALAGSAVATDISNNARILIGKNANIKAGNELAMKAASKQFDVSLAGKLGLNGGGKNAAGGTFAIGLADANSLVAVAQGAKLTAGSIDIGTENKIDHIQLSLGAGKGTTSGVSGMVGYLEGASNSLVSVDDEAVINAGTGAVNLNAKNDTNVYSAAGAVAMGENAGIGVAATITNFDRYTYAAIGDNGYAAPPQATTEQGESGSDSGDKLGEDANADRSKEAEKLANTAAEKRATLQQLVQNASGLRQGTDGDTTYTEQADFFGSKTADGTKGTINAGSFKVNAETGGKIINVAVAGGVSTADDSGEVGIFDKLGNFVSNKTNALTNKLNALDHKVAGKINGLMDRQTEAQKVLPTDQKPTATPSGQQSSVTIAGAGSAAINLLDGDTGALVDNVKINIAKDATNGKTITVTAKDTAMMVAAGGAAGISWKKLTKDNNANSHNAAFGGTAAVNDIDSQTLAVISNSEIENAAAIINNAQKSGSLAAAGLGLALAKNSGGNGGTNIAATVNASVNIADNTAYALLQNNKVNNENVSGEDKRATSITNTAFDNDIQITGGVNTSLSIGGDNAFVGGATVAYGSLKNDVQAAILGGTYDKITTADVKATTNMTQVGVAANVSVAGGAKTSYAFSGNSAYNKLDNYANATVEGVTLTGESLNVAAYDTAESANTQAAYLKKRGLDADGSAYLEQVKQAADESGDSDKPTNVDITRGGNVIVTGAVSVGVTTGNDGGSAAASVTVSDIDNDYNAKIKDSNITTTGKGSGDALVGTNVNAASHTVLAGFAAGVAGTAGSFGVGGSANWQSLNNDITAAVENSKLITPKTDVKAESGALAVNVAGQIGVTAGSNSKVGAGLAVAYNSLNNTTGAYVKGSEISGANDDASSILTVDAANKGNVYSVGAAVTAGTANALNGVVVVNRGRNDVEAVIDKYDGRRTKLNNMSKVAVKSSDDSNQLAVVGAVSVSAGSNAKFAAGGSVAYNEIGNITGSAGEKKQTNKAAINNADITTTDDGKISVNAVDESTLTTISVGTSITTGNVAFSGAGSAAMIKKDTDTELVNTHINKDKNNAATVQATADSKGKITTVAVVAAGAKDAAIGAGIAVNQLDADTNTTVTKGEYKVKGFTAEAKSDSSILSVGVAGGVAKTAGIAGNIGVNLLANDTKAAIDGAKINADGTLAVIAKSKDTLQNFAGAFGVAAGGQAGVGMGVAYNEISGTTESVVKNNAELTAAGNDAGVAVNERNKDNDNVVSDKKRTGVIIAADAEHNLTNVAVSAGVAVSADVGVGVAGTVTVNRILGATNAKVTNSSINAALTDRSKADVYVAANDATKSESHVGSLGVGGGADGGAGFGLASDTGVVSRNVTAMIDGGSAKKLVNGNSIDVAALNKAKMSTNSYGIAAAGGAYGAGAGAGTVSVAKLDAEITAAVKNIQGTNNGLAITADHVNDITLRSAAAAASGALVSAAGGAGIGVVDDDSKTVAELSGSKVTAETGDITVNAANKTDVTTAVFGVAASMVAGGLNVAVNNLDNTVSTLVKDNSNLQVQGTFAAKADNIVKTSFVNGADAVGAAGVAIGVGVNTIDTGVITEISGSKITAGAIDVAATEKLDVKQVVENAALGGHGYSANVSVTTIGAAAADQYGDSETTDSDKKATFNTNDILNKANAAIEGQGTVGTVTNKDGKSSSNAAGMTFDKYTDSNGQKLSAGPGTTASKGSSKAEGVQAKVSNSTLQATGDTKVNAKRTVDAKLTSAQVAGGIAGNGIAASVAVLDVERKTGVTINNNSKLIAKNVTLGSVQDGTSKIDAYQVAAGAAFAGSAAYAQNSLHGANAITIDRSTLQATGDNSSKGTLTVKAEDTSSAAVRTIGATAGAVAGGVLVTNATNNSDNTVTIGGSKLIAGKEYSYGNGYYNIGKVDVASVKANSITAETYGGMVGIAAAQGIVALATDAGSSKVNVTGASGLLGKSVSMNATNKPAVRAEAQAYSGGLLAVAGVAVSKAKASGTVEAKVADGSSFAADNVEITANVTTQTAKDENNKEYAIDNVSAKTIGATASGQYAAGFNTAYAENDMTVSVDVGKEQYSVNALKLKADNASVISADTLGVTVGGYIASGSNWSDTKTNLTTSVKAAGVKENVYNSLGSVNISSSGYSAVNNDANGYGGGIVGFNPVAARSQNQITTNTTADVSGKWQNVGSLSVATNNADKLDILADSLTAAVVGASGTEIKNNVTHNANINVTGDITTSGKQSYIANNTLNHDVDLKGSGYGGGSVNVNDMDNDLTYTAGVNINNATLSGTGSAGSIEALAYTDGKMNYSNTLKSAGVVPVTIAASKNVITYNNSINVSGSNLSTAKADQDITLAATDETTATFDTTADTQGGAVGAASAKTDNTLNRSNKITVTNGKILSTNDVNIYAGANLDGITSSLTYNVLADAYNKTAVPLATAPKAKNTMTQENQVSINGDIDSVRHVNFKAGKGMTTVSTSAREYNIYKGTSGSGSVTSTALGEVTPGETVNNYVDIASGKNVRAGIHNNLELTISGSTKVTNPEFDASGNVISGKEGSIDFSGIKVETGAGQDWFDTKQNVTADVVELQNGLYARLQEINDLLGQYASTSDEYSILNSERDRIITQMEENGFVKTSVEGGKTYRSIFDKISLPAVDVKDIVVSGGNINIEADKLQGSGSLTAQGAKNLTINNSSDLYLKINDLAIKDKGGVIRYNDAEVSKVDGFNGTMNNAAGTNADPKITVKSTGISTNGLTKPDIGIFGTVQNSTGDVLIQNSNYNINVDGNANISARNIELKADKGSVTQNSKGLLLIGGDPVTKYQFSDAIAKKIQSYVSNQAVNGKTTIDWLSNIGSYQAYKDALIAHKDDLGLTDAEVNEIRNYSVNKSSGIVAGNNVYISGLNVNLDGLVQSGYKNFKVTLDNAANNKIGNLDSDYARNRTALTDQYVMSNDKYCVSTKAGAVYNAATGAYDYTVKVYYNPATKELLTEAIEPNGGKIYITGALSSTGSGKLLAMDGTANIAIDTTNADRNLRVNKITNKDITGLISIKDTQKNTLTEYTTDGQKMSVKTTQLNNKGNATSTSTTQVNGSATTYKPADGMTINWTGGTSGDKKIIKWQYEKDFVFWGLIKYGTTKDFVENEEVKNGKTEVSSSSITGADPLGQGTVIKVNNNAKEYGVTTKDYNNPDESTYTPVVENKKYSGLSGKIFGYGNCTYTWTETQMHSTSSTYTIKGDKPINVGFMTGGSGDISVNSAKDMYLAGNISNATKADGSAIGKVTLNSNGGAISSVGSARVDADDLTAKAAKGISINHSALGNMAKLNIEATTGDVSINSDRGKLQFVGGNKGALSGNLVINAAGDITTASDTVLNGNRIDFTTLGAINAAIVPGQTLTSSDTMSASVNANAYGDITLTNSNGDMRIGHIASQTGDVSLTTSGSFIDAVGDSTLSDSESKLQKWQELGLINSNDKAEESAASAAAAKSERVQALEKQAQRLDAAKVDNYKAAAKAYNDKLAGSETLNQAKKAYIDASAEAAKLTDKDAQKQALTNARNAYMEALRKDSVFADKGYSDAELQWIINYAEVDNSTAYGWSKNELLYAIQDSVLNAAPGQVLTVDKANVQGKNISLSAGKNIGIDGEATNIAYSEMGKLDNLKLLAQAKAGDLTWNYKDSRIEVRQQRQITVKLADGGKLNLKANTSNTGNTGNVYLAGVKDTMLDISGTINTTQDVKLLSDKGIRMNDGSIVADNLIIQGGNGDVGSKDAFIKTNISGNLEANTDTGHGVYLHQTAAGGKPAQVLTIQDAATGTLVLKADNGMQMTTEAGKNTGYLNANSINLQAANGDIGKADDGIRILENGAVINAKAENGSVYLQGAGTKDAGLVVDSITAKGNAKLNLDGNVNFGNGATSGSINAGGDVTVNGNNVNLNAGTVTAGGAGNINAGKDVNVTTGSITSDGAGNITAGNNVNLNSSTLTAGADSVITATNGNIALGSSGITVNGANNGLKLDANGSVMQDAAAAGITADNLTVESGETQQLLSKSNKVKSLTIKGKNAGSSLMVNGVTRFNGTTDNLLVTVADSHIKGDVLIENYQADTGKITINSTIDTSKYNDEHTGNITVTTDGDITTADGVALNAADKVSINSKKGSVATGGNVTANNEVDIDAAKDITANGSLTSTNANVDLLASGSITTQGTVNALNNVIANANGNINTNGDVTATNGKAVLNSSAGSVTTKNVTAGQAVDIDAAKDITASGSLTSDTANVDLNAGGSITTQGTVNALNNVIANANGNINTNGDVTAETGQAKLNSSEGSVTTKNVKANKDVDIDAKQNITANGNLTSTQANVDLNAGGSITTSGQVEANNNVIANANGNINTNGDVTATNGNAVLNSSAGSVTSTVNALNNVIANANGDINTKGDVTATNGNAVLNSKGGSVNTQNVTAGQAVDIDAANNITANGSLTSDTANVDLNAGGSITTSGQVKAQQNVDYNAKGSITTEDIINSTAGNIHLQTDAAKGDITFGGDVTAEHGNINIDVLQNGSVTDHDNKDNKFTALGDKGDINSGNFALHIKGAGDVDLHEIYATNDARIDVAKGSLKLAKINGDLVALQLRTEGEKLQVDELIAGTKIIAQGSDIDLNKIQQRLDADGLLTIVPDGAQLNKPIDNLKIGEIITNKGVRFEHLWLNNGSIKVSEGMFHIDKLVVNNVAHFSNKHMKTAVWGAPPQRDGSDSVYWNNIAVNNPADNLTEWQQEGTNPDKWMYLHFTAQPNVQHSNGALLDLRNYDYVYDQRFTAVDHMLQQLNENKAEEYDINHAPDVVQYFRYDLYDLDEDDNKSEPVKITVEA
ncbi:hemagluttinin repeat protein [Phascolarctobacterium succinatutens CAG:287]|uniref:Hemagluttinin repeat protein n=1 Tax=Phascolarctobacterium succinatutens CAG:287 TaxID=1263101 RepID=R6WKZ9_9FIRM|nr:leukotoxin LktA family filamentous adhesin [Phascolarctobacterium succinatutens]CDD10035.1 hemagluttinin repeat protein [Phascolarctobacterium succinatutens CAG:287]